jgi:glycine cleavage system H protein
VSNIPGDLHYTRSHEWVRRLPSGQLEVGITDHAQEALGDLVFVEVPQVKRRLTAGEACAVVESVKAASDIYSPVAGTVVLINGAIGEKRMAETESKRRLDTLRAEYATALGKKGSLEAVIAEHGYSTDSVRRLFQSGALNSGFAPVGVLADFLDVDDRVEHVVEDFLRDELNYIVVKSWDAADEGMRLLRTDVEGRATFLVHPNDSQARFSFVLDEAAHQAPAHAHLNLVGWASMGLMGAFYGYAGERASRLLGWINYAVSTVAVLVMVPALYVLLAARGLDLAAVEDLLEREREEHGRQGAGDRPGIDPKP